MAEETQNTQEPLSEYSNINTELSTSENIQPFSGNMDLNIPTPGGLPINNKMDIPGPQVRKDIVGNPPNIPGTSSIGDTRQSMSQFIASNVQHISDVGEEDSYGKMFTYDAGPDSNNFYDRYAAYGDDKFTEVGFHPFRDNEANFNANTTMWNDWSRMMRHSFPTLLKRGVLDGPKSLSKLITGDIDSADLGDAEEYERAAGIGQSSKEGGLTGLSAFMNNTVMNFGYTAGIITEAIMEEIALTALTGFSGGATSGIQAARTGKLVENIGKGLGKLKSGSNAIKGLTSKLSNPTAARTFWQGATGKKLTSVGKLVNPLENTFGALKGIGKATKAEGYLGAMAKLSKTPGAFYRDVRNLNMAVSESRLEAGMVENKIFKKLYDNHYEQFGKMPDSDEQFGMRQQAKKGSLETFYANAGIIYVTNKITFGNITSPKGGLNNFLKQTRKDIYDVAAKSGEKNFGKLGKVIFDNTKKAFVFEKNNAMTLAKSWWKQPGYATAKKTLGYFKSNVSEGIQENLQETIARANEQHYVEAFKKQGPSSALYSKGVNKRSYEVQSGLYEFSTPIDSYYKELGNEFSKQGFETFMSGFMMGTFAKPLNNSIEFLSTQGTRIYNKDEYQKWKTTKEDITKGIVKNLNEINVDQLVNSRLMNLGTQEKVQEIFTKGGKKEALDSEVDSFVSTMDLMRRTNTTDVFVEKLKSMQELTDKELADAVDSVSEKDAPKYRKRLSNAVEKLSSIEDKFKQAEKLFENPVDIERISAEDMTTSEGQSLVRLHNAWNKSVENFVYLNTAFQDTAKRMGSIYDSYLDNTSLATADYAAAKVLFKPQSITRQIGILEQEAALEEGREDLTAKKKKENLKYKRDQIEALREFQNSQALFYGFYQRNETPTIQLAKKRLVAEGVEEPSQEQIDAKLNDLLGDITDEVKQTEVILDLKEKHDIYIKSLATENNATVSKLSLDKAFNELSDYYKLQFEERAIAEHIDLLTDPGEFLKLVLENEKVFEKLDAQRNELNSEIVDEQVGKVELTQLLNKLANLAPPVYMDKQQVLDLLNDKKKPKFFTGFKNEIYNSDSIPYEQGMKFINDYLDLRSTKVSNINPVTGTMMTEEMKAAIEEVNSVFDGSLKSFEGAYYKDGTVYGRVSNTMKKVLDDYGYNKIDDLLQLSADTFGVGNEFSITQNNIDTYINTITNSLDKGENTYKGFNSISITNLKLELESLMKGEILNSYKSEITKLESVLEEETNLNDKKLISNEIEILKSNSYKKAEINSSVLDNVLKYITPKITYESGRIRGNTLDDMVRDYFDLEVNLDDFYKRYEDKISENAFIEIFGAAGILSKLKEQVEAGEIYIFSKNLEIGDNNLVDKDGEILPPVAGALDLLIVDKTGKKYIVDLKTAAPTKWANYTTPDGGGYGYKKFFQNSMQQRAYANLYFNNTNGQEIETLILPIAVTENNETGFISDFKKIEDFVYGDRGNFPNLVEGNLFIKTDNNATIKTKETVNGKTVLKTIKVKDIDKFVPKNKIETTTENKKELNDYEEFEKVLIQEIEDEKTKVNKDADFIKGKEEELRKLQDRIKKTKLAKKTPDELSEEDKAFYEDLAKRKNAAVANIIDKLFGIGDIVASVTSYENNKGDLIDIEVEHKLLTPKTTIEQAKQTALKSIISKIAQLNDFDKIKYESKPLIENTIDNISGKTFAADIGLAYNPVTNEYDGPPVTTSIKINSLYVNDEGNYVMEAVNLVTGKEYYMTVTSEGDIIQYNREGATSEAEREGTEMIDIVYFENNSFARRKTAEDKANEKEKKVKEKTEEKKDEEETETSLELLLKSIDDSDNIDTLVDYDALELIKDELTILDYTNTKALLDRKASAILESDVVLESGNLYTFKESLDSKKMSMGDQVRLKTIDGKNKLINVKKIGKGNYKEVSLTPEEFKSKIDFGDKPSLKLNVGKAEVKKTGDVLKDFMNDSKKQSELNNSSENYLDETNDNDIFKC